MKILLFGRTGQVAREVLAQAGPSIQVQALGREVANLTDPEACAAQVVASDADVVINAAAYTAVDRAEEEEALATTINGAAPGAMARAAAQRGMPFLHVSTDYVFGGGGTRPWAEDQPTAPLNAYGRSKLEGELAVRAAGGRHVILRTSWVFSRHGGNFAKTMLRLAQTHSELNVVGDQVGGPTPARDIAKTLLSVAGLLQNGTQVGGTYHYAGTPYVSWAAFARAIFATANTPVDVRDIPTSAYPTPAQRPQNSRLDCAKLETDFGVAPPDWQAGLSQVITELEQQ